MLVVLFAARQQLKLLEKLTRRKIYEKCSASRDTVLSYKGSYDLIGHEGCVNAIAFNRSGTLLLSGSDDTTVRLWDLAKRQCIATVRCHVSNVFAADFLSPYGDNEIVTAGNDSDVRYINMETMSSTVYHHHRQKVLRLCVNPVMPHCFMTCSYDGTVRSFDVRQPYQNSQQGSASISASELEDAAIRPQALGGGRALGRGDSSIVDYGSLLLNYYKPSGGLRTGRGSKVLFSLDIHPIDGFRFIVGSSDGDIRLFDMRMINDQNPYLSQINSYRNYQSPPSLEVTGCTFSHDGSQIISTVLNDYIYLYDTDYHFERENNMTPEKAQKLEQMLKEMASRAPIAKISEEECGELDAPDVVLASIARYIVQNEFLGIKPRVRRSSTDAMDVDMNDTPNFGPYSPPNGGEEGTEELNFDDYIEDPNNQNEVPDQSYVMKYSGHLSERTIKGCNFYGLRSEYVMTGSDDASIYIWDKATGELLNVLKGHDDVVNCVISHPELPLIASSGIDDYIKIWEPSGEFLSKEERRKHKKNMDRIVEQRNEPQTTYGGCLQS